MPTQFVDHSKIWSRLNGMENTLKTIFIYSAVAVMLAACGGNDSSTEVASTPASESTSPDESRPPASAVTTDSQIPLPPADTAPGTDNSRPGTQRFAAGTHYTVLTPAQPITGDGSAVEVAEVFAYSCPHCFTMESYVQNWHAGQGDDVQLVQIPAAWGGLAELHARAFYTAEALGKLEQMHIPFFKEFHERRNFLNSEAKLMEFFARYDVDEKLFQSTFNSFSVNSKLQRAQDLTRRYQISETPMIVVNGKYVTRGSLAGTHETWFEIINELVDRERTSD